MRRLAALFHSVDVHQPAPDQFTTTVKIGTPAQEFTVLINMDSAVLWVPDATCGQDACAGYCKDPGKPRLAKFPQTNSEGALLEAGCC